MQIGRTNLMAISGGRILLRHGTVVLPVDCGYSVEIELDTVWDTYVVRRVFKRSTKTWVKGTHENVYADEVGHAAYYASCFRSYDADQWPSKV